MALAGKTSSALLLSTKLGGPIAAALDPFAFAFVAFTANTANATTYTFTAHALGAVVTGANVRHTIIAVGSQTAAGVISTITVGGLSAAVAVAAGTITADIWIVDTSSLGTTADIVVTFTAAIVGCGVGVYRKVNGSITPTDTDPVLATLGVSTMTLDIPAGGFAVAVVQCRESVLSTFTWTGTATPTEDYDADTDAADAMSGAISTATGSGLTFIATNSDTTPTSQRASAASWGP